MNMPHWCKSKEKMIERFKKRVFFYVPIYRNGCNEIKPCVLDRDSQWDIKTPLVRFFDEDMKLDNYYSSFVNWDDLFDSWDEAEKFLNHVNKLYTKGFYKRPFLGINILEKYKGELVKIEKEINEKLKDYPNFLGIDFCDINAYGIQVRGFHREFEFCAFGDMPTIKYDFTNKKEIIDEFVKSWKSLDKKEEVIKIKNFYDCGNKYGWD